MEDYEHIPVRPNINSGELKRKSKNIFEDNKDPDVQRILKKKIDVLDMETQLTKEESSSKKSEEDSSPWLIISLIIIVIILIIAIIYYVLKQNKIEPIPENIITPNALYLQQQALQDQLLREQLMRHQMQPNQSQPNQSQPNQSQPNQSQPNQPQPNQSQPNQPQPTKKELDSVLDRLNLDMESEKNLDPLQNVVLDEHTENLILDEEYDIDNGLNYGDANAISEFQHQILDDERSI